MRVIIIGTGLIGTSVALALREHDAEIWLTDTDPAAARLAARLAAQPPLAVRGARRALDAAWHQGFEEAFRVAVEAQLRCIRSEDFREAGQALAEGRTPRWRGRLATAPSMRTWGRWKAYSSSRSGSGTWRSTPRASSSTPGT